MSLLLLKKIPRQPVLFVAGFLLLTTCFDTCYWNTAVKNIFTVTAATLLLAFATQMASAQPDVIKKNLSDRLPNFPKIEEVSNSPVPGVFEIRINGSEILYSDAQGNHLFQGILIDTLSRTNLTETRINSLLSIPFDDLPVKDAFVIVKGDGKRKLAVFEDPNCSYCKKFERDLEKVDNVTVYVYLYPILGKDSVDKSRAIWCAPDKAKTFTDWMVKEVTPPMIECDASAVDRNMDFGKKHRITGTPTLFFADGSRVPGAIPLDRLEKLLDQKK